MVFKKLKTVNLQLRFGRILDDDEVNVGYNSVKYAFLESHGSKLGPIKSVRRVYGNTVVDVDCDILAGLVEKAEKYVREGTPERKTDKVGEIGSRAYKGIDTTLVIEVGV